MCDPNNYGAPPRSPIELAIRYNDPALLELLLQFQADLQLRAEGREFPIIAAAARRSKSFWLTARTLARLSRYHSWIGRGRDLRYVGVKRRWMWQRHAHQLSKRYRQLLMQQAVGLWKREETERGPSPNFPYVYTHRL